MVLISGVRLWVILKAWVDKAAAAEKSGGGFFFFFFNLQKKRLEPAMLYSLLSETAVGKEIGIFATE